MMAIHRASAAPLFIGMLFTGCLETNVSTTISDDGACERVIWMELDSKNVPSYAFPLPADTSWSVAWEQSPPRVPDTTATTVEGKYYYVARKRFRSPEDLHREYAALPDTGSIDLTVAIDRRFAWFYTYFDYREVYRYRDPHRRVPVTEYLSRQEIEQFVRGEKNDTIKMKVDKWTMRNLFEEWYAALTVEATRRNEPAGVASLLRSRKMKCFDALWAAMLTEKDTTRSSKSNQQNTDDISDMMRLFADVLGTDAILAFTPFAEQAWESIENRETAMKHPNRWRSTVVMPGLLLDTNGDIVKGNAVRWSFEPEQLKVGDYAMTAESRVTNTWTFIVTGVVALLLAFTALRAIFKKHKYTTEYAEYTEEG